MKFARFLRWLPFVAAFAIAFAAASEARAAIYACTDGIQGDATAEGFEGCIEVVSVGESLQMPLDTTTGTGSARTTTAPIYKPFRLIKQVDRSSPVWRDRLLTGTPLANDLIVTFTFNSGAGPQRYFEIKMTSVLVTSVSMTADGGADVPMEVISLNPLQVDWSYTPYDNAGNPQQKIPTSWDFGVNGKI